jgi:hypothetical protein
LATKNFETVDLILENDVAKSKFFQKATRFFANSTSLGVVCPYLPTLRGSKNRIEAEAEQNVLGPAGFGEDADVFLPCRCAGLMRRILSAPLAGDQG